MPSKPRNAPVLFTVGHSTRSIEELIGLLKSHRIQRLVDVRTIPKSRKNPQFNREELRESLKAARLGYRHRKGLGGLRHPKKDSVNTAWKNASFRGYADYMQTEEFEAELQSLMESALEKPTAVMCAEALPWRCHRSLIADALLARGWDVRHIMSRTQAKPHALTSFAKVRGTRVKYPGLL